MARRSSKLKSGRGPDEVAATFSLESSQRLFAIGTFDDGVTVLSQQKRALNLAWALIESRKIPTRPEEDTISVAIVGAGFAGLTFASALLQKNCRCDITIFEERDTLLPLQQGSDTRWLHPHIYDWPEEGSEAAAAMLPVLNWTAARASDVVVQVLSGWKSIVKDHGSALKLYCNTRHLQVQAPAANKVLVEWVGDQRAAWDGNVLGEDRSAKGQSQRFDLVILAVGFGLEVGQSSYWRNEVYGQPSLTQPRRSYLISGQGDGAMIDLLRLKVSQFRQDRILTELFDDKPKLITRLRAIRREFLDGGPDFPLFAKLDSLCEEPVVRSLMKRVIGELGKRLRRDTEIVLHLKVRNFSELLQSGTSRISFQNAVLVYLLYRAGGFAPSNEEESQLVSRFDIPKDNVVWRHGVDRIGQLRRLLPANICKALAESWEDNRCQRLQQSAEILWRGGYFGSPGRLEDAGKVGDRERKIWRKEYLPGPTSLIGHTLVGALEAEIGRLRPHAKHFRITMHRVLSIHGEDLLQQLCGYVGRGFEESAPTAGRTFPAGNATIGLAYRTRQIIRSRPGIDPAELSAAMAKLHLNEASRKMADEVGFVAAVPVLQPDKDFFPPSPVCGIIYFDSRDPNFDLETAELAEIAAVVENVIDAVARRGGLPLDRIENIPLRTRATKASAASRIPSSVALDLIAPAIVPPRTRNAFILNFDHSDLTPLS